MTKLTNEEKQLIKIKLEERQKELQDNELKAHNLKFKKEITEITKSRAKADELYKKANQLSDILTKKLPRNVNIRYNKLENYYYQPLNVQKEYLNIIVAHDSRDNQLEIKEILAKIKILK